MVRGDAERVGCLLDAGLDPDLRFEGLSNARVLASEAWGGLRPAQLAKLWTLHDANHYVFEPWMCPPYHWRSVAIARDHARNGASEPATEPIPLVPGHVGEALLVVQTPTPLHLASFFCHAGVVSALLDHGADVKIPDARGYLPLHYATCRAVVDPLLAHGAPVDGRGPNGLRPLHVAASREVADALLAGGAAVDAVDDCGNTPLHTASVLGVPREYLVVTDRLRERGRLGRAVHGVVSRVAAVKNWIWARLTGSLDVPGLLRARGASDAARNGVGKTPREALAALEAEASTHHHHD